MFCQEIMYVTYSPSGSNRAVASILLHLYSLGMQFAIYWSPGAIVFSKRETAPVFHSTKMGKQALLSLRIPDGNLSA